MLYHSSVIDDPFSVLDLCELHGSSYPDGATRTRHDDAMPSKRLLLHVWIVSICRASHWSCRNLVLLPGTPTILSMNCISVGLGVSSLAYLQAPKPTLALL